jgi:hypothetical protein
VDIAIKGQIFYRLVGLFYQQGGDNESKSWCNKTKHKNTSDNNVKTAMISCPKKQGQKY